MDPLTASTSVLMEMRWFTRTQRPKLFGWTLANGILCGGYLLARWMDTPMEDEYGHCSRIYVEATQTFFK